jgi:hypothetical protein
MLVVNRVYLTESKTYTSPANINEEQFVCKFLIITWMKAEEQSSSAFYANS